MRDVLQPQMPTGGEGEREGREREATIGGWVQRSAAPTHSRKPPRPPPLSLALKSERQPFDTVHFVMITKKNQKRSKALKDKASTAQATY